MAVSMLAAGLSVDTAPADAAFPGANGKIVFSRQSADVSYYLYMMDPDGTNLVQLTKDAGVSSLQRDQHPSVSPDGTKIVFQRNFQSSPEAARYYELHMVNAGGSGETNITRTGIDIRETNPSFSPDGKRIAFVAEGAPKLGHPGEELYTVDVTTIDPNDREPWKKWTRLTFDAPLGRSSESPSFSPDGTKIAFNRSVDGNTEIFTVNSDGTGEKRLTSTPNSFEQFPTFSPDGTKIAFTGGDTGGVFTINADGSRPPVRLGNSTGPEWGVTFSPDGSQVAFMKTDPVTRTEDLFTMNVANDGSGQTKVTSHPLSDLFPDWGVAPGTVPPPTISVDNARVNEGDVGHVTATFTVSLSRPVDHSVAVSYATADGTATAAGNQADYVASSGTLTFAPGEKTKTVAVSVNGDRRPEPDETFFLYLSSPSGATLAQNQGTGTIVDDEQKKK